MKVRISKPCAEDWSQMVPEEQGRFCASCQKCVFDFTPLSDSEMLQILKTQTGQNCGRFRADQLERVLIGSNRKNRSYLKALFSISWISLSAIGSDAKPTPQYAMEQLQQDSISNTKPHVIGMRTIYGTIKDISGTELIGVAVSVKTNPMGGTTTDMDGYFSLPIPDGTQQILVTYVGYVSQEVPIESSNHLEIILTEEISLGPIVVGGYYKLSRWQRFKAFFRKAFQL